MSVSKVRGSLQRRQRLTTLQSSLDHSIFFYKWVASFVSLSIY